MIGNSPYSETLAIQLARGSREIGVKSRHQIIVDHRHAIFSTKDDMNQVETQRLGHRSDYMSGLQPFTALDTRYLGLRPRLICRRTYGPKTEPRFKSGVFAEYINTVSRASQGAITT